MTPSPPSIHETLRTVFKKERFRNSQERVITRILQGEHALVLMPTGMGKSLCYQLPALHHEGLTLVISPLIALMKDQVDALTALGVDAAYINSSLSKREREARYRRVEKGAYKLLFVTPERFRVKAFTNVIATRPIALLAVDEAHCISQWGHDFRPDYSRVGEFRRAIGSPTTIALTATATPLVQDDIIETLGIARDDIVIFNEGITRENLALSVETVIDEGEKFAKMTALLQKENGARIVYFNLIKSIDRFAYHLEQAGVLFRVYHGKLASDKRKRIQRAFQEEKNMLLLATNAFGMGIDKSDIRLIVHAEIPDSLEAYYQEIGRAGRDGLPSRCVLFYCEEDLAVQLDFLKAQNPDKGFIVKTYRLLESLAEKVRSYTYGDLQEELVFKNRGDHRLQTVLSLFDRYGVTKGTLETHTLKLVGDLPSRLTDVTFLNEKLERDRMRLVDMLHYVKTEECRKRAIHEYFAAPAVICGTCDNCLRAR